MLAALWHLNALQVPAMHTWTPHVHTFQHAPMILRHSLAHMQDNIGGVWNMTTGG